MPRLLMRLAPSLILGPVTGPLAVLGLGCLRRKQWLRLALCVLGIAAFWVGMGAALWALSIRS